MSNAKSIDSEISVRLYQPTFAELEAMVAQGAAFWHAQGRLCEADSLPPDFILTSAAKHLTRVPEFARWYAPRLFLDDTIGAVVGSGIYKGVPSGTGAVEIGYGVAQRYWNRGYATQAVRLLVAEAYATGVVTTVLAHAAVENLASQRVLQKCGFVQVGEIYDFQDGILLRFERRNRV